MDIITLRGCKNSGKTTALRNLYQEFLKRSASIIEYKPEGSDKCDFTVLLSWNDKKIVIKSMGDAIKFVREGVKYATSKGADVLINAWNTDLDKKYKIKDELSDPSIIDNPISICGPLRAEWQAFNNDVINRM